MGVVLGMVVAASEVFPWGPDTHNLNLEQVAHMQNKSQRPCDVHVLNPEHAVHEAGARHGKEMATFYRTYARHWMILFLF